MNPLGKRMLIWSKLVPEKLRTNLGLNKIKVSKRKKLIPKAS